ncbi:MAG: bifunctional oligoribonuclease/PAP phosphatase NrnA [Peptococcaceae bacterium]|nr:bifunctional oligoribonuclease/PAP phosphatase NrnA [Peptococcaceae bacterium]
MTTSNSSLAEVVSLLKAATKVLLIGHVAPDGDSLGSSIALCRLLRQTGKEAYVACLDRIPPRYEFLLKFSSVITVAEDLPPDVDFVVVLDCGDLPRTGLPLSYTARQKFINIDHHTSNTGALGHAWVDSTASAVGQQVLRLLDAADWPIDKDTATCLYTSLATDSGFFRHANTTPTLLREAARLLECGADARLVVEHALERKSLGELCLIKRTLGTLSLHENNKIALLEVSLVDAQDCGVQADEVEEMVDFARAIPDTAVAVLLKEMAPSVTKVSLRSKGRLDVSKIAEHFGGGGHRAAAGATMPLSIDAARHEIIRRLAEVLNNA